MAKINIHLLDEVNVFFEGLPEDDIRTVIQKTKLPVKGAFTTPSYQLKLWDGKESFFGEDGLTFLYMVPEVIDVLVEHCGYSDDDFDILDEREHNIPLPSHTINADFLKTETGFDLIDYQVSAINAAIEFRTGIVSVATSGGKSFICLGISKFFNKHTKVIILTPSQYLVNQLVKDYSKTSLSFVNMSKVPVKKREQAIKSHDHIIMTHKLLLSVKDILDDHPYVVIYDEAHNFGDITSEVFRDQLRNCPVRIGLTGSIPPDRHKAAKIFCHFSGGSLIKISAKQVIAMDRASSVHITMHETYSEKALEMSNTADMWDWETEFSYMVRNRARLDAIVDFIKSLSKKNTLILCQPQAGEYMCQFFNGHIVNDDMDVALREELLAEFDKEDVNDHYLFASFGTSSTGISVNDIQRVIFIDIGKDETRIKQSVGRAMRLDGKDNHKEILDIYSCTKYGVKHAKVRRTLYKKEGHPFIESPHKIFIQESE